MVGNLLRWAHESIMLYEMWAYLSYFSHKGPPGARGEKGDAGRPGVQVSLN